MVKIVISPFNVAVALDNTLHAIEKPALGQEEIVFNNDFKIPVLPKMKHLSLEERGKILYQLLMQKYNEESEHTQEKQNGIDYEYNQIIESGVQDYFLSNYEYMLI